MNINKPNQRKGLMQRRQQDSVENNQKRVEKAIAGFSHAHMSNAKWRKVFRILSSLDLGLTRCHWKFVGRDTMAITSLPQEADLLDAHLEDGLFQPEFVYREIEWIEIPAQYQVDDHGDASPRSRIIYQNVTKAMEVLNQAGNFPVDLGVTGLTIRGYS